MGIKMLFFVLLYSIFIITALSDVVLDDFVQCASFPEIGTESRSTVKGIFCRMHLQHFCGNTVFENDEDLENIYREQYCDKSQMVNTYTPRSQDFIQHIKSLQYESSAYIM